MGKLASGQGCSSGLGEAVRETLLQALQSGRLVTGGLQCAHVLETEPLSVMLCVVPQHLGQGEQLTLSIQRTLTEAFCLEYELNLIEVDEGAKLARLLRNKRNDLQNTGPAPPCCPQLEDLSCLLVLWPNGAPSPKENQLLCYCDDVMRGEGPLDPVVTMPD